LSSESGEGELGPLFGTTHKEGIGGKAIFKIKVGNLGGGGVEVLKKSQKERVVCLTKYRKRGGSNIVREGDLWERVKHQFKGFKLVFLYGEGVEGKRQFRGNKRGKKNIKNDSR